MCQQQTKKQQQMHKNGDLEKSQLLEEEVCWFYTSQSVYRSWEVLLCVKNRLDKVFCVSRWSYTKSNDVNRNLEVWSSKEVILQTHWLQSDNNLAWGLSSALVLLEAPASSSNCASEQGYKVTSLQL